MGNFSQRLFFYSFCIVCIVMYYRIAGKFGGDFNLAVW